MRSYVLCIALACLVGCDKRETPAPPAPAEPAAPTPVSKPNPRPDAAPALTVREVCERVGRANCERAAACTNVATSDCLEIVLEQCCASPAACARPAGYTAAEVSRCADAFGQLHCRAIKAGTTPTVCGPMVGR